MHRTTRRSFCIAWWLFGTLTILFHFISSSDSYTTNLGQLEGAALETAAKEWLQYLRDYDELSEVYDRHDTSGKGFIEHEQLTKILTELNDGVEPLDEDVKQVMSQASVVTEGKLSKPVMSPAVPICCRLLCSRDKPALTSVSFLLSIICRA